MKTICCVMLLLMTVFIYNASGEAQYRHIPAYHIPSSQPVDAKTRSDVITHLFQTPLHFVANQGQMDQSVIYYARSEGATVYCTHRGLTFGFAGGSISLKFSEESQVKPKARAVLPGKVNYFTGNNPASWRKGVCTYGEVVYPAVYPGIDLVYSGDQRRLKYTLYVQPGSNPNQIQMIVDGAERLWVDRSTGELVIETPGGELRDAKPVAHQQIQGARKEIAVSFCLKDDRRVGFALGDYNAAYTLAIDPTFELKYATYLGGSENEEGRSIAFDNEGNFYVTGYTESADFPTASPYQDSLAGGRDVFVAKFSSDGTTVYCTYLGGRDEDVGNSIAADAEGNAYITGSTSSDDFPTKSAYKRARGIPPDVFVAKVSSGGDILLYSTYLGGNGLEQGRSIVVDGEGNAYVAGQTNSSNFPTQNAYQSDYGGQEDAFLTKLSSTGATLEYSTYLGGSGSDVAYDLDLDNSERTHTAGQSDLGTACIYVVGQTESDDFPVQNAYQGVRQGDIDAFVTKFSNGGAALEYSTYLGGSSYDAGEGIAVDDEGTAYIAGQTTSDDFPLQNPYQSDYGGITDAFLTRLSDGGDELLYSTYLGGTDYDVARSIAIDNTGNAYVGGFTTSTDFPSQTASSRVRGGETSVGSFVVTWNPLDGSVDIEFFPDIIVGSDGTEVRELAGEKMVTTIGQAGGPGLTTTPGSHQSELGGKEDAFVAVQTTAPNPETDLELDKGVDKQFVKKGDKITFKIKLTNKGPNDAKGVIVTDEFDSEYYSRYGWKYVTHSTARGTYEREGNLSNSWWHVGDLAAGESVELYITMQAGGLPGEFSGTVESVSNSVDVSSYSGVNDWNDENNRSEVRIFSYRYAGLFATARSPVGLVVTDPAGSTLSEDTSEIPSGIYIQEDIDGDGEPDDTVFIYEAMMGEYSIQVVPKAGAAPTDTYTLEVTYWNRTIRLAEDVEVQNIPDEPYTFFFPPFSMRRGLNFIYIPDMRLIP